MLFVDVYETEVTITIFIASLHLLGHDISSQQMSTYISISSQVSQETFNFITFKAQPNYNRNRHILIRMNTKKSSCQSPRGRVHLEPSAAAAS